MLQQRFLQLKALVTPQRAALEEISSRLGIQLVEGNDIEMHKLTIINVTGCVEERYTEQPNDVVDGRSRLDTAGTQEV